MTDLDRHALQSELLAFMQVWQHDDARFERLALRLFAWQFEHIACFRAFCQSRGATPASVSTANDVPLVPVTAFKFAQLSTSAAVAHPAAVFETSGTSDGHPGRVHLQSTALYDASLDAAFDRFVVPDRVATGERLRCLSLVPSLAARPCSSLGHMVRRLTARWDDGGASQHLSETHGIDGQGLVQALDLACEQGQPVLIFATTLALDLWLQQMPSSNTWLLPKGSRIMDTGGPKGRHLSLDRVEQHRQLTQRLGLDARLLVGELGMTELASQRYETTLRHALLGNMPSLRAYAGPPWLRTRVVRPEDHSACAAGEVGMLGHIDLANLDTCAFILTADLGREVVVPGFGQALQLGGRIPGAEWRGCGLDAEALGLGH